MKDDKLYNLIDKTIDNMETIADELQTKKIKGKMKIKQDTIYGLLLSSTELQDILKMKKETK